jgi:hypothetical protein
MPLGRPRRRSEDITLDLEEMVWEGVKWTYLAQDRDQRQVFLDTVTSLWLP